MRCWWCERSSVRRRTDCHFMNCCKPRGWRRSIFQAYYMCLSNKAGWFPRSSMALSRRSGFGTCANKLKERCGELDIQTRSRRSLGKWEGSSDATPSAIKRQTPVRFPVRFHIAMTLPMKASVNVNKDSHARAVGPLQTLNQFEIRYAYGRIAFVGISQVEL